MCASTRVVTHGPRGMGFPLNVGFSTKARGVSEPGKKAAPRAAVAAGLPRAPTPRRVDSRAAADAADSTGAAEKKDKHTTWKMANRSDPMAQVIHGTNPQRIVEKILRTKVYATQYWKEYCFGLTAETLVDRAIELEHIGGTYGGIRKPTKFMCLLLKMLQIQPDQEIVVEFIKNEEYKYVRVLGALYLRCVGRPADRFVEVITIAGPREYHHRG